MDRIAIVASLRKRSSVRIVREAVEWLQGRGLEVRLQRPVAARVRRPELGQADEVLMQGALLALAMGGDGTMLATARLAAPSGIPILGCNLGGFGFLTEVAESELAPALQQVLEGKCEIRDTMMVEGILVRAGQEIRSSVGLNEIVVTKGAFSRTLHLEIEVLGEQLGVFAADGVIVATPAGSTAYSLSAGGPVVSPEMEALIVTPLLAHTLSARPLVVRSSAQVLVNANPLRPGQEVLVTIDGQPGFPLEGGDLVRVRKAQVAARMVHVGGPSFFVKLRTKLGWAGRS